MARLVLLQGGKAIPHELGNGETLIGRHTDCTLQLQSNTVSRRHASVTKEGSKYFVEDLDSGNGTILNGKRINERVQLSHEDRIKLGPILLRYEANEPAAGDPKRAADLGNTVGFTIDYEDDATIIGAAEHAGGFGVLDVQPEAKLKAILEISRSLVGTVELESLLPKILDTLFGIFSHADRGCILLKEADNDCMIPKVFKHRRSEEDESVKLSRTILNKVLSDKQGILSADAVTDSQFSKSESISSLAIHSMMCAPLLDLKGEPIGVINIDTQNPLNQFKNEDLDLLMAVAGQAALAYESARLMVSHIEKQKQDGEMKIASAVQQALLPKELPKTDGYQFYASYDAAQAVGGDYYDVIMLDDDKICLSFGDVAGKGVPGALIMSRMASCVQNTMSFVHEVADAIGPINNHMCANTVEGRFVTYLLAIIDLKTHEMSLADAGHMSPMILKTDGTIEEIDDDTIGLPVGVMENYPFSIVKRVIEPGEVILFFTDGVDEAMNPEGELYTLERMREFVTQKSWNAEDLGKELLADVRRHANGRPQNDDITIMTFGRCAE